MSALSAHEQDELARLLKVGPAAQRTKERVKNKGENEMAEPVKIVIVFYSRNGSTAALAEGIAEGARAKARK